MACFIVPAVEAVVVKAVEKAEEKKETRAAEEIGAEMETEIADLERIPLSRKLRWLSRMLWGGVVLLLFEHIWHGEIVPWFPFLTAMSNSNDAAEMFREMATVGTSMALLITLVWIGMCLAADVIMKSGRGPVTETRA